MFSSREALLCHSAYLYACHVFIMYVCAHTDVKLRRSSVSFPGTKISKPTGDLGVCVNYARVHVRKCDSRILHADLVQLFV
jgi:hypothetical protein